MRKIGGKRGRKKGRDRYLNKGINLGRCGLIGIRRQIKPGRLLPVVFSEEIASVSAVVEGFIVHANTQMPGQD